MPRHLRMLLDVAFGPLVLVDGSARLVAWNREAASVLEGAGIRPGDRWPASPPQDVASEDASWEGRLDTGEREGPRFRGRPVHRTARGRMLWLLTLLPVPPARRESGACRAFEGLPTACCLLDSEGRILHANAAFARLAGRSEKDVVGAKLVRCLGLGRDVEEMNRSALRSSEPLHTDHVRDLPGGRKRVFRFTRVPLRSGEGRSELLVTIEDITADLDSADGLAGDGRLVQSMLSYMPGFVSLKDVHTRRFVFATGVDQVLADGDRAALIGRSAHELYPEELADAIDAAEQELIDHPERILEAEFEREVAGERKWFYSRKLVVPDARGKPRYILTFNLDVSDQVRAKRQAFETSAFLDAVIDYLPALVWVREFDSGRVKRVNHQTCKLLGCEPGQLVGRTLAEIEPELGRAVARADRRLRKAPQQVVEEQIEVELASGRRSLQMCQVTIPDAQGSPKFVVTMQLDVTARVRIEEELAESRRFLRQIIAELPVGLSVKDGATRRYLLVNRTLVPGPAANWAPAVGQRVEDVYPPSIARQIQRMDDAILRDPRRIVEEEMQFDGPSGRVWHRVRKVGIPDDRGGCRYIVTVREDVTERRRMLEELRRSEASLKRSQAIAGIGSWRFHVRERRLEWSEQMYVLWGVDPRRFQPTEQSVLALLADADRARLLKAQAEALRTGSKYSLVVEGRRASDGVVRHMRIDGEVEWDADRQVEALFGTCQDITESIRKEAEIRRIAQHDPLTGLPNRLLFEDRLQQAVRRASRTGLFFAVHCLDLNDFKGVNDSLGHAVGDELLRQMAARLQKVVRGVDTVARLGGDEFAIIQSELRGPQMAANLAERTIRALGRPYRIGEHELYSSASIGIAIGAGDERDANEVLRHADLALYAAKAGGRGGYRFFSPEMNAALQRRRQIEERLRKALDSNGFTVHYQPQVALRSGQLRGAEALLRWHDPELGTVPPDQFIAVAEDCGLILELGRWVLHSACRQGRAWQRCGLPIGRIAVNLSPAQFSFQDLADVVAEVLGETGLDPSSLELEITESTLMRDYQGAIRTLQQLHELGVSVALDDFGTGYSSLSYLKRFPLDKVKIDRSFVTGLPDDADDAAIARTIIQLGKTLGLRVLAEGVETEAQRQFLLREGCDEAQGFLFSPPIPAEELEWMFAARQEGDALPAE